MSETPQIRIEMRSNPLYLSGAREMVSAVARRLGFDEEACGQIALAVDEALCNVIRHGYNKRTNEPIWISLYPVGGQPGTGATDPGKTDAIRIVIEDEAEQVDPARIRSRNLDEVRPGGLGVHIICSVMDSAVYERRNGKGMRLTMIKNRTRQEAAGAGSARRAASDTVRAAKESHDG